jgi:hypothetical protein
MGDTKNDIFFAISIVILLRLIMGIQYLVLSCFFLLSWGRVEWG